MSKYVKFISALLGGIATWGYTATTDAGIDAGEWFGLLGVLATSLAVFQFPNTPAEPTDPEAGAVDAGSLALGLIVGLIVAWLLLH